MVLQLTARNAGKVLIRGGLAAAMGFAFASVTPAPATAATRGEGDRLWSSHHDGPATDCADLDVRFDRDERAIVKSEEKTITKAEAPTLRVHAETNGGVQLQGWDKDTYSVTTCKFAAPPQGEAEMAFSQIHVNVSGGE